MNSRTRHLPGFTLLEVLLAISIASAILAAALFFYQQTSDLRTQLVQETQKIATVRMLMDRLTADLRSAYNHASPDNTFVGSSNFLSFVKTDVPSRSVWNIGAYGRLITPETDLRQVSYRLNTSQDGTNILVGGLDRIEKPLVETHLLTEVQTNQFEMPPEFPETTNVPPLTEDVHYLRFRFWDGSSWLDNWDSGHLPLGVEVSMGWDPMPTDGTAEEYPYELFRRVIYLPASGSADEIASEETTNSEPSETEEAMP
jgi:prepilin-type N-terminal cleavage/methylation domain-containing protein